MISLDFFRQKDLYSYPMKLNIKKLEHERKRLGLTKAAFSKRFGLTVSTYSKMVEHKSTKIVTLTKIASVLKLDPRDLLSL